LDRVADTLKLIRAAIDRGALDFEPETEGALRKACADLAAIKALLMQALGMKERRAMILVASQRGGAKQLGAHLLRTDENEHVDVLKVRGFVSDDVTGALKKAQASSASTKCKQYLFSASLNPPDTERVEVDAFEEALTRIERERERERERSRSA